MSRKIFFLLYHVNPYPDNLENFHDAHILKCFDRLSCIKSYLVNKSCQCVAIIDEFKQQRSLLCRVNQNECYQLDVS